MQPVIPATPVLPQAGLTVEVEAFAGQNNIRRSLGRAIGAQIGSGIVDRQVNLAPDQSLTITELVSFFIAISNGPLAVTVNTLALAMNTLMVYDTPTTSNLVFHNASTTDTIQLHLTYLLPLAS